MVREVQTAADQAAEALLLPPRLGQLRQGVAELSDAVSRRYFALLPASQSLGLWPEGENAGDIAGAA
jgi:hypothetical protein